LPTVPVCGYIADKVTAQVKILCQQQIFYRDHPYQKAQRRMEQAGWGGMGGMGMENKQI
jgi:hypothetical protein